MTLVPANPSRSSPSSGTSGSSRKQPRRARFSESETVILIVDDHPAILEAVSAAVEREEDMRVGNAVGTAEEVREFLTGYSFDVLIVDISFGEETGLTLIENVLDQRPETKVLVYSMFEEGRYAGRALRAGARGYVHKSAPTEEVVRAIRRIERGEISLSPNVTSQILGNVIRNRKYGAAPTEQFTDRELTVFKMIGSGQSVPDIADRLDLSRKTVETYRRRAKEKLGYETVDELLQFAVEWCGQQTTPD